MRADFDAMLLGQPHSRTHMVEVRGMEPAGDVGSADQRHQPRIVAHFVQPEGFAHVAVEGNWHLVNSSLTLAQASRLIKYDPLSCGSTLQPGSTTIVVVTSSMTAGPENLSPVPNSLPS